MKLRIIKLRGKLLVGSQIVSNDVVQTQESVHEFDHQRGSTGTFTELQDRFKVTFCNTEVTNTHTRVKTSVGTCWLVLLLMFRC